jgi:hypothetical protein
MVNRPPVAYCHGDTTMTVCSLSQICLDGFTASDPDHNLQRVTVTGGTLQGNTVCSTPAIGLNTITLIATDSCGAADTCQTRVSIIMNSAPIATCPNNTVITVDSLTQICLPGFSAHDVDGNLVSSGVVGAVMHGDTACFVPVLGMNTLTFIARDACGLADTCITRVNVALSHVGSCPIITRPFNDTLFRCTYGDFCDTIDVVDPDGDMITVTTTIGTLTPLINIPGHWRGLLCFDVPDSACANNYSYSGIIKAYDGLCGGSDSTLYIVQVLGKITVSMPDSVGLWPGVPDSFPVFIDAPGECFCLGGFVLTITYDNSIFDILGVTRAPLIAGAEYFYVNDSVSIPGCPENGSRAGAFKVTMMNDLNNQVVAPPICDIPDHTPLFWVHVLATANYNYPSNFCVPICFQLCEPLNYQWNSITDSSGHFVWKTEGCIDSSASTMYLELICGNLKILDNGSVMRGDINLNGQPFEIGDAVFLANYLIDPIGHPMSLRRLAASDVNLDGIQGSIADLIYLINVINGTLPVPKVMPVDAPPTEFIMANENGQTSIRLKTQTAVGGFIIDLPIAGNTVENLQFNPSLGLDLQIAKQINSLRIVAYSLEGNSIAAGDMELFTFYSPMELQLENGRVSVSDDEGNMIPSVLKTMTLLPTEFCITGSYPNPFNSSTMIECALPQDDAVSMKIYDLAGRLVSNIILGQLTAGQHRVIWDGVNSNGDHVSSGIYFVKLESRTTGSISNTKKLVLLR